MKKYITIILIAIHYLLLCLLIGLNIYEIFFKEEVMEIPQKVEIEKPIIKEENNNQIAVEVKAPL